MEFMNEAIQLSNENVLANQGGPFGCVIVENNKIISKGQNLVTSLNDPTCHAEIVAIRNACKEKKSPFLNNCIIYCSCEPCPMCYGAIKWAKINKIYYCNTRQDAKNIGFDDNHIYDSIIENKQNMIQLINSNGINAFKNWNKSINKISY